MGLITLVFAIYLVGSVELSSFDIIQGGLHLTRRRNDVCSLMSEIEKMSDPNGVQYVVDDDDMTISYFYSEDKTYKTTKWHPHNYLEKHNHPVASLPDNKLMLFMSDLGAHYIYEMNNNDNT